MSKLYIRMMFVALFLILLQAAATISPIIDYTLTQFAAADRALQILHNSSK